MPRKVSYFSWEKNPIFLCTILMNVIVLLGYFFEYPNLGLDSKIGYAASFHIALFIFYLTGYFFYRNYAASKKLKFQTRSFKIAQPGLAHRFILLMLLLFGVYASVETISHTATIKEYLLSLMSGVIITRGIEVSSTEGGAAGIIKLMTFLPLVVFSVYIIAIRHHFELKTSDKFIFIASIVALVFKVLFTLDRLTIIYLIVSLLVIKSSFSNHIKKLFNIFLLLVFVLFIIVTLLRISEYSDSIVSSLFLYSRLGLENFQVLLELGTPLTLGSQTIFNPVLFLADRVGLVPQKIISYEYFWNPAQYFYGHLYMDYGIAVIPAVFIYGILSSYIESKSSVSNNKIANALFLPLAINSFTGIGVVWIRGIEFYFVVLLVLLLQLPRQSVNPLALNQSKNSIKTV